MLSRTLLTVAIGLFPLTVLSQASEGLRDALLNGPDALRVQALESLGLSKNDAEGYKDQGASLAGGIQWFPIADTNAHLAAVFLPCLDGSSSASLLLLQRHLNQWKTTDSTSQDCHYNGQVAARVVRLQDAQRDNILVEHDTDEHGTGYVTQFARVFEIRANKLVEILKVRDKLFEELGDGGGTNWSSVIVPVKSNTTGVLALEETRIDHLEPTKTVRRYFYWSDTEKKMKHTQFEPVLLKIY